VKKGGFVGKERKRLGKVWSTGRGNWGIYFPLSIEKGFGGDTFNFWREKGLKRKEVSFNFYWKGRCNWGWGEVSIPF